MEQPSTNDSITICREYFNDTRQYIQDRPRKDYADLPTIYFVTPTYPRREQVPEIIRLGHTLMHVPKIHWIVADDVDQCNVHLDSLLMEFGEFALSSYKDFVNFPIGFQEFHLLTFLVL